MAFVKETLRNEIMLRFGEKVDNRGKLIGASQRSLEQVLEDGAIISSKPLDPEQLSALPGQAGTPLADVLGEVTAQTIIDNQNLNEALTEAGQTNDALRLALVAAQGQASETISIMDQMQGELMAKDEALSAAHAEIQRLTAALEQATALEEAPEVVATAPE